MQTKKIMAVLLAVVLMIGILPKISFAASTDIVITSHVADSFQNEIFSATSGQYSPITSISVSGGNFSSADWVYLCNLVLPLANNVTKVDLSGTTTSVSVPAFNGLSALASISLPSGAYPIGDSAFSGCTGLTAITIPAGVTSIGNSAFRGCTVLTSVTIPDTVTSIGGLAFFGCTGLTAITIPASVTSIGDYTFNGCTGLSSVTGKCNIHRGICIL